MIWLTWRQFRPQAIVAAGALAVLAVLLAVTGMQLGHLYSASGFAACRSDCGTIAGNFISEAENGLYTPLFYLGIAVMYAAPALMGIFWGAPLVTRELEAGTLRLAWNQSVTRTRWLAVKLGLIGLAATATAGLLSIMIGWWASPIDRALQSSTQNSRISFNRLAPLVFAARGVAPVGYAAFAFVLGVAAGVLTRRTVAAMAVTLAIFVAVQVIMPTWVRPHLIAPVTATAPFTPTTALVMVNNTAMTVQGSWKQPGAWILSNQTITPAGHLFTGPATQACLGSNIQACTNWLASKHLRQLITYQPASRFWALQWYETGIFLLLTLALAGICTWRIRRRLLP